MADLPASKPPKLLNRMREALRVRHYSYRTAQELLGNAGVSTTMVQLNKGAQPAGSAIAGARSYRNFRPNNSNAICQCRSAASWW